MSALSVPLRIREDNVGALNLYSRQQSFDDNDERVATEFALQATVALANARAYEKSQLLVTQLEQALETRDVIGQAKGVLMQRDGCDADEAFQQLVLISQRRNVKLRDIALEIVGSTGQN